MFSWPDLPRQRTYSENNVLVSWLPYQHLVLKTEKKKNGKVEEDKWSPYNPIPKRIDRTRWFWQTGPPRFPIHLKRQMAILRWSASFSLRFTRHSRFSFVTLREGTQWILSRSTFHLSLSNISSWFPFATPETWARWIPSRSYLLSKSAFHLFTFSHIWIFIFQLPSPLLPSIKNP